METPQFPKRSRSHAFAHKIHTFFGFEKGYNFALWFCFAGALFGFSLARFMYLNFHGQFCPATSQGASGALPGECFYYLNFTRYKVGIMIHLATILPAGLLVVLQFTPIIRRKWILFHRINGHVVLTLFLLSTIGVLMIARHAFGGGVDVQAAVGAITISTIGSFVVSYVNVKRRRIEQHRAWMIRGWFYAGTIITTRLILIISASVLSASNDYYTARPCAQLAYIAKTESATLELYPDCKAFFNGTDPGRNVVVHARMGSGRPSEIAGAFGMSFGMALWVSLWLHAIGVEIYLHLVPYQKANGSTGERKGASQDDLSEVKAVDSTSHA